MPPAIKVIGDTIVPFPNDPYTHGLTPRETQVRIAAFVLNFCVPIAGALLALFANEKWYLSKYNWSYHRLCTYWFLSVSAFIATMFVLPGQTTRTTIVMAIIHVLIEISILTLLLGKTASQGLLITFLSGFLTFTVALVVSDVAWAYFTAVVIGGVGDALMPLLLFYGQQPVLALGSLAHAFSAAMVFLEFVHNIGVVGSSVISYLTILLHMGLIVAGLRAQVKPGQDYAANPMKRPVPWKVLKTLLFVSAGISIGTSSFFTFIAPKL